jgi:hypothetical protein
MRAHLTTLSCAELEAITGGGFRAATFGALQLLSVGMGDPADAPERPPITMSQPARPGAGGGGFGPFSSYGGRATARFGY